MRILSLLPASVLLLALAGCTKDRTTAGGRGDIDPSRSGSARIQVEYTDSSLKSSLRVEDALTRV